MKDKKNSRRKPEWLKIKLPMGDLAVGVNQLIQKNELHTICTSGMCPNQGECWGCGTATFMIGGDICTRGCRFCNVKTGRPNLLDENEPDKVATSIKTLKVKHAVITSVDRDDLEDYGANHWAKTIKSIKELNKEITMEVLIPDFNGELNLVDKIIKQNPEVISHNMETTRRLTPTIRSKATYNQSLKVLKHIADSGITAKSGIMLGLGETEEEILQVMDDLLEVGVKVMTIGQYLQPTKNNVEVEEYVSPEKFAEYKEIGLKKGFKVVESGPLVRSSYHAERHVIK
ncbi:MAG: lipoyl synthase [Marinifilaceae bacterium]|jgi:lipoic acid synthetase|nr:lipoyl synthase [Marinifilaceae bacterium]